MKTQTFERQYLTFELSDPKTELIDELAIQQTKPMCKLHHDKNFGKIWSLLPFTIIFYCAAAQM